MGPHLRCACRAFLINGVGLGGSCRVCECSLSPLVPSHFCFLTYTTYTLILQAVGQNIAIGGQGAPQNPWMGDSLAEVFAASVGESL